MGFPGTSIDDLELVPEDAEENKIEADESEDDDEQSNSKCLIVFFSYESMFIFILYRICDVSARSTGWSCGCSNSRNTLRSGGYHKKIGTF